MFPSSWSWKPLGFLSCRRLQLNWKTTRQMRLGQSRDELQPLTCNFIFWPFPMQTNQMNNNIIHKKTPGKQHIPSQFQLGSERWLPHPRLLEIHCYLTPCLQSHLASHCCPRRMEPVSQSRKEEMYRYRPRWNTMRGPLHPPNNSSANTKPDFIQTTAKASPPSFLGF